jgi:hypothetical protein
MVYDDAITTTMATRTPLISVARGLSRLRKNTEGHHQEHDDGGGDGHAGDDPCTPWIRRQLGLEELPEPHARFINDPEGPNRRKRLVVGCHAISFRGDLVA